MTERRSELNDVRTLYLHGRQCHGAEPLVSVYADHLSALVTVKDNYLSALVGQIESESEMI